MAAILRSELTGLLPARRARRIIAVMRIALVLSLLVACSATPKPATRTTAASPPAEQPDLSPGQPGYVNTGDPIPTAPPAAGNDCPDRTPGASRWVDSNPHTPLAIVDRTGIHDQLTGCCASWARRGTRWHTIDRYGAIVGDAELVGGEGYDVTQCYELSFAQRRGDAGVGLYVSDGWTSPASVEWTPEPEQRRALAGFVASAEQMLDDPSWSAHQPGALPVEQRVIYFQVSRAPWEGNRGNVDHYAVVGGRALLIVRLNDKGRWVLSYFDRRFSDSGIIRAYTPLAVVDLDGNGAPEIIFHWNAGDGWSDTIFGLDVNGRQWEQRAESIGGSTA